MRVSMERIDKNENFKNVKTQKKPLHQSYEGYYRNFVGIKNFQFLQFSP